MTRQLPASTLAASTGVALVLAAVFAVPAIRHWNERPPEPPPAPQPVRAAWLPPANVEVGAGPDYVFGLALAPDGRRLVYPGAKAGLVTLWLHDIRTGESRTLPGTDQAAAPFWAPDGSRIGFFAGGQLRAIELASGTVSTLADAPSPRGGTWNAAGEIVFAPSANGPLMARAVDGSIRAATTLDRDNGETAHVWPAFLEAGRHLVFLATATTASHAGIWLASIGSDSPEPRLRLVSSHAQPVIAGSRLLFLNDRTLLEQPIDLEAGRLTGRSRAIAHGVGRGPLGQISATVAADLLIHGGGDSALRELRWVTSSGEAIRTSEPLAAWDLRIAPDGRRVAITEVDPQLRTLDVFIREGTQPAARRLSPSTDVDESAVWSPDGLRVAWAAGRRHVVVRGAGAMLPEQTIATLDPPVQVWDWSRDGRRLLIGRRNGATLDDLWVIEPREGAEARVYAASPFNQIYGVFSPDGRWVAYASDESGQFDIYIDSFPNSGSRTRVTTAGGTEPRWHRDGGQLYFRRGSELHVVTLIRRDAVLAVDAMDRLFDAGAAVRSYDVSPDGRFLLNLPADLKSPSPMTLIHHWSAFAPTLRRDESAFAETLKRGESASARPPDRP
jgi:WD40 repeat protein